MIVAIARHQVLALRRQRVLAALLVTLLFITAMAAVIGWSSHNTIVGVYNVAADILAADGKAAPTNPFALKPTLSMFSNLSIYLAMVGALLAIVVGHLSVADDQSTGIGRLIHSRPISRRDYALGKIVSVGAVLAVTIGASFLVSAVALPLVNQSLPSVVEYGRLLAFYLLSWLYLLLFALIGMVAVLVAERRSTALLAAMGVWLVLTFAVPQFTSGTNPVASLNPVTAPVGISQPFFAATAKARGLSLTEQYKAASGQILRTAAPEPAGTTALRVLPLLAAVGGLGVATERRTHTHDWSKGAPDA